jgi:5-methylthioadenosine/S-adenosylhomocysteine deaminase
MKAAMRAQRFHFKDRRVMPPGKVLEMATIDGYKALGLDKELGSVEIGKKADLITIDLDKPHLRPIDMVVYRVVYQANGADVTDVLVDGRIVMKDRKMHTVNERSVLDRSQVAYDKLVERCGLSAHTQLPKGLWGSSRLTSES